ncbi:hypothetical protein [Prauserella halophila]|uniref:hypothetical protein n=1 Tax=Prauserella halophila TaxID=185641 RepID=UPI0020A2FB16|nr:hypothetical protein [Prauserella halophila]MCP2238525.1 hypothetical protein [Prauserella halophila]
MTLENSLRTLAFGDPGEPAVTPDHRIAGVAARARTDRECWLAAVVLGAHGRYAAATTLLHRLRHSRDVVITSLAASTIASHRRQLGGHAAALPADGAALAAVAGLHGHGGHGGDVDGIDVAGARADALLGLAADHLALGRPALARRLVGDATAGLDAAFGSGGGSRRSRIRAGWVGAEAALAGGDPATAVVSAEEALRLVGAVPDAVPVRHRAKTELVLAAALLARGPGVPGGSHPASGWDPAPGWDAEPGWDAAGGLASAAGVDAAGGPVPAAGADGAAPARPAALVTSALAAIDAHGFASLSWPGRLLAADADPARADEHRRRATREVHALLPGLGPELRRLAVGSPWLPV